jgi:uncharacterized protein YqgC (DUF456 family)
MCDYRRCRMSILLWVLGSILVAIGLVGIVLPALPGTMLIFGGLLVIAWADGFSRVGVPMLVLIGVIAVASYGVDFVAGAVGAKQVGASPRAVAGAALGTLLGLFFGLPGLIFGPLIGAVLGELSTHRNVGRAAHVGMAAWVGFFIGTAVKIAMAFSMIAIFLAALFWF